MTKTIEEWRADKARLDALRTRGQQWVNIDQRRNLYKGYERSRYRHRQGEGPKPVSRTVWEERLDTYLRAYGQWKAEMLPDKPAKPSHFVERGRNDLAG